MVTIGQLALFLNYSNTFYVDFGDSYIFGKYIYQEMMYKSEIICYDYN